MQCQPYSHRSASLLGIFAVSLSVSAQAQDTIPIVAGEYETISTPGNHRNSICFRNPTVGAPILEAMMNYAGGGRQSCKVTPRIASGNQITVRIICQYGDGSDGRGEMIMTTAENTFASTSTFEVTDKDNETRTISTKTNGKRVGDCG